MPNINTQLRDISITHQHMVERYKTNEMRQIGKILDDLEQELRSTLQRRSAISNWTVKRKQVLLAQVKELQKVYHGKLNDSIENGITNFGMVEMGVAFNEMAVILEPFNLSISMDVITPEKLLATAKRNKILFGDGSTFTLTQMLRTFEVNDISRTKQVLQQGFLLGDTGGEIERKLFRQGGKFNLTRNNANTLVSTSISHMANTTRDLTYRNNTDVIKGYQWLSTLDERTTDICISRDGQTYFYDVPEKSTLPGQVRPPAHFRCRSTTVPITRSWKELGLDLAEMPPGTRASMNGQVPENVTYKEWLKTAPTAVQRDVLGRTRYDMWKKGDIDINSFWTKDGRRLTLSQLKKRGYDVPKIYTK